MGEFVTRDKVTLRYLEAGAGDPLLIVPGWSASAATFERQLEGLSDRFRVIALDMRGHGRSDKPDYGYRVSRFAADLRDGLEALGLSKVTLLGHSLGCVMIWSYLDLFGEDRLSRLVFVDQPAVIMRDPAWPDDVVRQTGAPFTPDQIVGFACELDSDLGEEATRRFLASMPTQDFSAEAFEQLVAETLQLPRRYAAKLFLDGATVDYRDVLARITLPTLYIGGRVNTVRMSAQRWICEQIPDCRHVTFTAEDRGSHFMYLENPDRFNAVLAEFLATT